MRIEELQNQMYIKSTDSVEKYLLNIIKEYFRDSNEALEGSKEYIIREAVDRLRTEMDYNSLGVLSITLPDGRVLTGDVTITIEDLGGEPLISPKLSAFNVDFGTEANTACEGNDPRLYDARKPIVHEHEIEDIRGLEGILSTILGEIQRTGTFNHEHDNKRLLDMLTYSGKKERIDLTILDTLESRIEQITEQIKQDIEKYTLETDEKVAAINEELSVINQRIDEVYQYVLEKCEEYLIEAKRYTDEVFTDAVSQMRSYVDQYYVRKDRIQNLIDIANSCYTLVNTERWGMRNTLMRQDPYGQISLLQLSQKTRDELQRRSININNSKEIIFNFSVEYTVQGVTYKQPLPYLHNRSNRFNPYMYPLVTDVDITGVIQPSQSTPNVLTIAFQTDETQLTSEMLDGQLVCDIYSKSVCTITY